MNLQILADKSAVCRTAATQAANAIRNAIGQRGDARIIAATGSSQLEFLEILTGLPDIAWKKVELFHLDEYIGLAATHPASFRRYLQEHLIQKTGITNYHLLEGDKDPAEVMRGVGAALQSAPIDIAFTGLGENGHLAFNDPPADFATKEPYIQVNLDIASRRQQVEEGWFPSLEQVPQRAISMSIWQILQSKAILCIAPEARKAQAVKECFEGEVSPLHPASALRTHPNVTVYLDESSASLLNQAPLRSS